MAEERRRSVRIKKVLTVRYSYDIDSGTKKWDMTTVKDISETGMSFVTHRQFVPNDVLNFFIKIPTRPLDWIEFTARVVGSGESGVPAAPSAGCQLITRVEFINLKEEQKGLIRQYIEWFLSKEGGGQK